MSTLSVQLLVFLDYFSGVNRSETGTTTITISVSTAVFQVTWLSQPPCFSNLHVFWDRTFVDKWCRYLWAGRSSWHAINSVDVHSGWLASVVVSALDLQLDGRKLNSQPGAVE